MEIGPLARILESDEFLGLFQRFYGHDIRRACGERSIKPTSDTAAAYRGGYIGVYARANGSTCKNKLDDLAERESEREREKGLGKAEKGWREIAMKAAREICAAVFIVSCAHHATTFDARVDVRALTFFVICFIFSRDIYGVIK